MSVIKKEVQRPSGLLPEKASALTFALLPSLTPFYPPLGLGSCFSCSPIYIPRLVKMSKENEGRFYVTGSRPHPSPNFALSQKIGSSACSDGQNLKKGSSILCASLLILQGYLKF